MEKRPSAGVVALPDVAALRRAVDDVLHQRRGAIESIAGNRQIAA
jgi:hypothetical protein